MRMLLSLLLTVPALASPQCGSCPGAAPSGGCSSATVSALSQLTLRSADGDTVRLADYIGRRPTVVTFLQPGSASTVAMDTTSWTSRRYPAVAFLGIMAADLKTTKGAVVKIGPAYPLLADPGRAAQGLLGIDSLPVALFFDSTGAPVWQTRRFTRGQMLKGVAELVAPAEFTDPVCRMKVTPATAAATVNYQGTTYYFCNTACRDAFLKNPEQYLR